MNPMQALTEFDAVEFRRICAGLVKSKQEAGNPAEFKSLGIKLATLLATLFGESLDRVTLWARITTALKTARANTQSGDADRFLQLTLDHVKADSAEAVANAELMSLITTLSEKSDEWRNSWFRYLDERAFIVVASARSEWEQAKQAKKESRHASH